MAFVEKKRTHVVIKKEDVLTLLTADEAVQLAMILAKIETKRRKVGKKTNQSYYVVNQDEPYAQEVFEVIKRGETAKEAK